MSSLFEPVRIGSLNCKNRFVRSATWEGLAEPDGACSERLIQLMAQLASGGVGLIITGHAFVSIEGSVPRQLGMHSDRLLPFLRRMTAEVHQADGKIVAQLGHAGCWANPSLPGYQGIGPTLMQHPGISPFREMDARDVQKVIDDFGRAACRAREADFDGVQIHAAHGYLLSQFLSPFFNRRQDDFGGNVESRARIAAAVVRSAKTQAGKEFPVLIKLNSDDFMEPGVHVSDMLKIASIVEKAGVDAIEISGGIAAAGSARSPVRTETRNSDKDEAYYKEAARQLKHCVRVPVILSGGIRTFETAEHLVSNGISDHIALARPLIKEPHLINRWESGDTQKSTCRSDNYCLKEIVKSGNLACAHHR